VVKEGNYTDGFGRGNGWGGAGYGGFVGAKAMQGLMAYYYDMIRPNTAVELNQCRFNHMGMNVVYNASPNFNKRYKSAGLCRNNNKECEDCMTTDFENIYNVHYTQCKFNMIEEGFRHVIDILAHNRVFLVQVESLGIVSGKVSEEGKRTNRLTPLTWTQGL
jgi:hypothetical protein